MYDNLQETGLCRTAKPASQDNRPPHVASSIRDILPGRVAAFIKRVQIISIETLFSVLFRRIVSSGVRFAGILREGEKAVFFPMAWTTAGGSLVWGGWAFLPQGVGAGHRDVVKILQQAVDGGLLAGFVSSNDCLGIIKRTLFKENISHFQIDGRILS